LKSAGVGISEQFLNNQLFGNIIKFT